MDTVSSSAQRLSKMSETNPTRSTKLTSPSHHPIAHTLTAPRPPPPPLSSQTPLAAKSPAAYPPYRRAGSHRPAEPCRPTSAR